MRARSASPVGPPAACTASATRAGAGNVTTPGTATCPDTCTTIVSALALASSEPAESGAALPLAVPSTACPPSVLSPEPAPPSPAPALDCADSSPCGIAATSVERPDSAPITPDSARTSRRTAAMRNELPSSTKRRFIAGVVSAPTSSPAPRRMAVRVKPSTFSQSAVDWREAGRRVGIVVMKPLCALVPTCLRARAPKMGLPSRERDCGK